MSNLCRKSKFPRRLPMALTAAIVCMLAAGAASAWALPVNPVALNTANWSSNAGFGSTSPGWSVDSFGVVHLQGAARQTSSRGSFADLLGTVPPTAAPNREVYSIVHTFAGTYADLRISPNGQIHLISAAPPAVTDLSFVSLESISYPRFGPGATIAINSGNWSPSAGLGSVPSSYYEDPSGIVHLEGAARQLLAIGPNANLIGTLPPAATPMRAAYTIVHTRSGTYADLVIGTDGTIRVIDPRPPAVKDLSFVSLESITYQRSPGFPVNPIPLNTLNWSPAASSGTAPPGWFKNAFAFVHLQGAARQVFPLGPKADLLGTLPVAAAPANRFVYTIIATANGTYADLSISPTGDIRLIGPRPPAVKDYRSASPESISYQQ
jgi:hypothetical protein